MNCTHENHLNSFIIYGEHDKVISRTCDTIATRFPDTITKYHQEKFQEFWAKVQKNKPDGNISGIKILSDKLFH